MKSIWQSGVVHFLFVMIAVFVCGSVYGKNSSEFDMDMIDFFAAPKAMAGGGNYSAGDLDEGRFGTVGYGGKLGVKLGPIFIGGEYLEGKTSADSSKALVPDSTRLQYPLPDQASFQSIGVTLGFNVNRFSFWGSFYPYESMTKKATVAGAQFEHQYHGSGQAVEATFRVWNLVHVGAFYHINQFNKYTSDNASALADKADLDPSFKNTTYGITLSYLIPFSQVQKFIK